MRQVPGQTIDIHLMASITWNCILPGLWSEGFPSNLQEYESASQWLSANSLPPTYTAVAAALVGDLPIGLYQLGLEHREFSRLVQNVASASSL